MSPVVLLDAGPLSLVTNPKGSDESRRCKAWLAELVEVLVATSNVGHLGRFVDAREWETITTDRPGGMELS